MASFIKTQASSALTSPVGTIMRECAARNARRRFLISASAAVLSATSDSNNLGRDDHIEWPREKIIKLIGDAGISHISSAVWRCLGALFGVDESYANLTISGEFVRDLFGLDKGSHGQLES